MKTPISLTTEELAKLIVANPTERCNVFFGVELKKGYCDENCPALVNQKKDCPALLSYRYYTIERRNEWAKEYLEQLKKLKYLENLQ